MGSASWTSHRPERWLGETELVGVVPAAERDQLLLGLRGITSRCWSRSRAWSLS